LSPEATTHGVKGAVSVESAQTVRDWKEGDDKIVAVYEWVAQYYEHLPEPRPVVVGEQWTRLEAEIDWAYATHDLDQLRTAIRAWAVFAVAEFKQPVSA
jgi:hypothetical protein